MIYSAHASRTQYTNMPYIQTQNRSYNEAILLPSAVETKTGDQQSG
jgi:hypothetical protein